MQLKTFEEKQLELIKLNVNKFTEQKKNLTYLSWASAWEEFIKVFPDATYKIKVNEENQNTFFGNSMIGYMVHTEITAMDITRQMWLPILDGANKPMKDEAYTYTTKYGNKKVEAISMFDVNKALMRCLVKNLAMFGLGIYIYKGEDLPTSTNEDDVDNENRKKPVTNQAETKAPQKANKAYARPIQPNQLQRANILISELGIDTKVPEQKEKMYKWLGITSLKVISEKQADTIINKLIAAKKIKKEGK